MSSQQRIGFNSGHKLIRVIAFILLLIISFVIPNNFFVVYAWICLVLSVFFLVVQLILLLDFSYSWNEAWSTKEETKYKVGLIASVVILFGLALTITGLMYKWFGSSSCQTGQALVSTTLLSAILYTVGSVFARGGSILPAGVVFLYTAWTCYSALQSGVPEGSCNTITSSSTTQLIIGSTISMFSLVIASINAATSRDAFQLEKPQETEEEAEAGTYTFFHLMMLFGSGYLAMLLTSWSVAGSSSESNLTTFDSGLGPMWAKFSSELLCIALYFWTLIAPYACPNRFGSVD